LKLSDVQIGDVAIIEVVALPDSEFPEDYNWTVPGFGILELPKDMPIVGIRPTFKPDDLIKTKSPRTYALPKIGKIIWANEEAAWVKWNNNTPKESIIQIKNLERYNP
jgi:hypothetical protein